MVLGLPGGLIDPAKVAKKATATTDTSAAATPPPKGPAVPGVNSSDNAKDLKTSIDEIRKNLRALGTAIGTGATTVLAGVGWTTVNNLFPAPQNATYIGWVAFALAFLAAGSSMLMTATFFAAQRRVVFDTSDVGSAKGLTGREKRVVTKILTEKAEQEGAADAKELELRVLRLDRIARELKAAGDTSAQAVQDESDRLNDTLNLGGLQAVTSVVERRSENLFKFRPNNMLLWTGLAATVAVVGLFMLADFSKGQRDLVTLQTTCATSTTALPACSRVAGEKPPGAATNVITRLQSCAATASGAPIPAELRDTGILACAGLVIPSPAAVVVPTPSPATSPTPGTSP